MHIKNGLSGILLFLIAILLAGSVVPPQKGRKRNRNRNFNTGILTTPIGARDDVIRDAAFTTAGRLVAVGRTRTGMGNNFAIVRYYPDGSLDSTFSEDGIVNLERDAGFAWAHAVAIDSLDRIIAVGRTYHAVSYDMAVVRLQTDGSLDTTFSSDGYVRLDFNGATADFGRDVALHSDDRIVIAGYSSNGSNYDFAIARLLTNGGFDTTFDTDGMRTQTIGTDDDVAHTVVIKSGTDDIFVGGYSTNGANDEFAILMLDSSGTPVGAFSGDGIDTLAAGSNNSRGFSLTIKDSNDKPTLVGSSHNGSNYDFHAARWNDADGVMEGASAIAIGTAMDAGYGNTIEDIDSEHIAVGRSHNGSNYDFATLRHANSNQALDNSWNSDGLHTVDVGGGENDTAYAVAYQDHKIVVVGRAHNGSDFDFALVRYNSDGSILTSGTLDLNFASNGFAQQDFNGAAEVVRGMVGITSDGFLYVGGFRVGPGGNDSDRDFAVARYTSAGALDGNFGTGGLMIADVGTNHDEGWGVAVQSDGKVLVGGFAEVGGTGNGDRDFAIVRFTTNGVIDVTYSTDGSGIMISDLAGDRDQLFDIAIQSDGKVLAAGYRESGDGNSRDFYVMRHLTNGQIDGAFAQASVDFPGGNTDEVRNVTLQPDEKVLLGGFSEDGGAATTSRMLAIARIQTNGIIDTTFSDDGRFEVDILATDQERVEGIAVQPDGKIVAVGWRENGAAATRAMVIIRVNSDGSMDTTFATNGIKVEHPTGSANRSEAYSVLITQSNKILVIGRGSDDVAVVRYMSNGTLDTTFSNDGLHSIELIAGRTDYARATALQRDGRVLLGGQLSDATNGNDFIIGQFFQ